METDIQYNPKGGLSFLLSVMADIHSEEIKEVAGREGVNLTKHHLRRLDKTRANRLGGKRSGFYAEAADSTFFSILSNGAEVHISKLGMRQRYYGGTIRPVNAKHLAIPARKEAYGRSPEELKDLKPAFGRKGIIGLQRKGLIYFWLVKSVTQKPDHSVVPENDTIANAVQRRLDRYLTRQIERAAKKGFNP